MLQKLFGFDATKHSVKTEMCILAVLFVLKYIFI